MRALLVTLLGCCALQGCKSEKLLAVERDLAATRARLDALTVQKNEALAKSRERNTARWTYAQQADQTEQAQHRLAAALDVLGGGAVPKVLTLADALASKTADVNAVAADIVSEDLPCVAGAEQPGEGEAQGEEPCHEVPLEDACESVPERTEAALTWSCEAKVPGRGGPDSAVCLASYHYPTDGLTIPAQFVATELDLTVVRVAFEHQGRLYVADYPAPSVAQYRPKNVSGLDACAAENSNAQCVRSCESTAGRVPMTGWCGGEHGDDGDEGGEGGPEEPPEVTRAREEAERTRAAAAEAETELAYQQCMAGCGPEPTPEPEPEGDAAQAPPDPPSVEFTWRGSPAPGLYVFDKVAKEPQASWPNTAVLLLHPKLGELLDGTLEVPEADTLYELELQAELIDATATEPDHGKMAFIGLDNGEPAGVIFSADGKGEVKSLTGSETCGWLKKAPKAARTLRETCAKRGGP